jgi:hypothetical protein
MDQQKLKQRKRDKSTQIKPSTKPPKPKSVSVKDIFARGEDIIALGSDEKVYTYDPFTHSWFLL